MKIKMKRTVYPRGGDVVKAGTLLVKGYEYEGERAGECMLVRLDNGESILAFPGDWEEEKE